MCKTPLLETHNKFLADIDIEKILEKPLKSDIEWKVDVRPKKGESWVKKFEWLKSSACNTATDE